MINLFETKAKDGSTIVVHASNDVFRVLATAGRGSIFFHVTSKKTLKGAIGAAKKQAA